MKRHLLVSLLFVLFTFPSAFAGHYITGYFEWDALGNDSFKVTINVYRDCNSILGSAPKFSVKSVCSSYSVQSTKTGTSVDVTPVCKTSCTRCTSPSCTFSTGIEKLSYSAIIDLSQERKKGCCNVSLSVAECCRVGGLTGGSGEAWHQQVDINPCVVPNSSPKWSDNGPILLCIGRDQKIDCSITTGNPQDSVVYRLKSPLKGLNTPITWKSGYSAKSPLNYLGYPKSTLSAPRGFNLDTVNGLLLFRPMTAQIASMSVTAEIYRKGVLVGSVSRESQVTVLKCPTNSQPTLSGVNCKKSSGSNLEMEVCPGTQVCFKVCTNDNDRNDSLTLDWNKGIPGATFTTLDPKSKQPKGEFCWTPTASDVSTIPHKMVVTVFDDACPINGITSQVYNITVKRPDSAQVTLYTTDLGCNAYRFRLKSVNNVVPNSVDWFINDSIPIGKGDSIDQQFDSIGTFIVSGVSNGCYQQILKDTIQIKALSNMEVNGIDSTSLRCAYSPLKLRPMVTGAVGTPKYSWKVDASVSTHSNLNADSLDLTFPNVKGPVRYLFNLELTDSLQCTYSKDFEISALGTDTVSVEGDYSICEGTLSTLTLKQYGGLGSWSGPGVSNNVVDLKSLSVGQYVQRFSHVDSNGCFVDSSIIEIKGGSKADAGADFTSCTSGLLTTLDGKPVGGSWKGQGINANNEFEPFTLSKGNYPLSYEYINSSGCSAVDSVWVTVVDYKLAATVPDSAFSCDDGPKFTLVGKPKGGFWAGAGYVSSGETVVIDPSIGIPGRQNLVYTVADSNQCIGRDTTKMVIDDLPWANFTVSDSLVEQGKMLPVQNNSQLSTTHGKFTWIVSSPTNKTGKGSAPQLVMDSLGYHDVTLIAADTVTGCSDTVKLARAVRVILNTSTTLERLQNVRVFPNPVSNQLQIVNTDQRPITASIFSMDGRLLQRIEQISGKQLIDLSQLSNGLYTLELRGSGAIDTRMIMKE